VRLKSKRLEDLGFCVEQTCAVVEVCAVVDVVRLRVRRRRSGGDGRGCRGLQEVCCHVYDVPRFGWCFGQLCGEVECGVGRG